MNRILPNAEGYGRFKGRNGMHVDGNADEEEQKKALEGLKDVESEGRVLVIKVALGDRY